MFYFFNVCKNIPLLKRKKKEKKEILTLKTGNNLQYIYIYIFYCKYLPKAESMIIWVCSRVGL